jgi:hypothetical protein
VEGALVNSYVCHAEGAPDDALRVLVGLATCCIGAMEDGPASCTCWEVVYDREQSPINRASDPTTRSKMCEDCAYRPDSPERSEDDRYIQPHEDPEVPFWCHQGMRKEIEYRHTTLGIVVPASGDFYKPPIREGVPYMADGSAGQRCAGWAAKRRQAGEDVAGLSRAAGQA